MFVVDLSQLEKPEDIRADDLVSWVCNGKWCNQCEVEDDQVMEVRILRTINSKRKHISSM